MRFEKGKRYIFRKEIYLKRSFSTTLEEDSWVLKVDGKEVTVDKDGCGKIGHFSISPAWCEEIKERGARMKKTNKTRFEEQLKADGFKLNCYNADLDRLPYYYVKKIIKKCVENNKNIEQIKIKILKNPYVATYSKRGKEVDLSVLCEDRYLMYYGEEIYSTIK